jgi:phenylacetate-CoA ligase
VGEPIAALWGNVTDLTTRKQKLKDLLLSPHIWLDTMEVTERSVLAFARDWKKARPTLLFGHAHSLFLLAHYVQKLCITEIRPKAIISTSMMLLPNERALIEQVFDLRVFDRYGCEEVSLIASECERHEGMHLNVEHLYIEFVKEDGGHAEPGEPGKIVVTDLMNYAMPFIRYDVEDVGIPKAGSCSCGRGMPLMEHVTGRVADFLLKPDGTRVAGVSLIENTLTKYPGIDQMQIIQETVDGLTLRLVTGPAFSRREAGALLDYFHQVFGRKTDVRLEITDEIRPESSGKYRFSICRIP